jgi:hypothetical protein
MASVLTTGRGGLDSPKADTGGQETRHRPKVRHGLSERAPLLQCHSAVLNSPAPTVPPVRLSHTQHPLRAQLRILGATADIHKPLIPCAHTPCRSQHNVLSCAGPACGCHFCHPACSAIFRSIAGMDQAQYGGWCRPLHEA